MNWFGRDTTFTGTERETGERGGREPQDSGPVRELVEGLLEGTWWLKWMAPRNVRDARRSADSIDRGFTDE